MTYNSCFKPGLFKEKVILVTGGATGIGRVIAYEFASLSGTVILASRNSETLSNTAKEISRDTGGTVDYITLNIRSGNDAYEAIKEVLKRYGRLTHLINNAGGQFLSPAEFISEKGWKTVIDLNLHGTFLMIKAAFELYMKDHGGIIANILVAHSLGFPLMAHSGAARAGIENLSKSLAMEWGRYGIRINSVASGTVIGSGMTNYPEEARAKVMEELPKNTALRRLGTEAEIAATIVFLSSPASSYISGETIKVDGGLTLAKYPNVAAKETKPNEVFLGFDTVEQAVGSSAPSEFKKILSDYLNKSNL